SSLFTCAPQPAQKLLPVAAGRGESDALQRPARQGLESGEHALEVPSAIITSEGMDLIDDDGTQIRELLLRRGEGGDQHCLQRLRGGEQDVRWLRLQSTALPGGGVTVAHLGGAAQPLRVCGQAGL